MWSDVTEISDDIRHIPDKYVSAEEKSRKSIADSWLMDINSEIRFCK